MRSSSILLIAGMLVVASASARDSALIHKKKYAMGTIFEIVAYDASPDRAAKGIEVAFQKIVRLDDVMSNYKSDSDLSRLNGCAHFHACAVSFDLYRVIEESLHYSELSNGKFDITVAPLVEYWKALMRGERRASLQEEQELRHCIGYRKIKLLPPNRIEFLSSCLEIDLGAIGKGYAVDRAVEVLRSFGISSALINAGNSTIFVMGSPPGQPSWLVHLRDPSGKSDPQVRLCDNSVSTSEQTPASQLENNSTGHIIDPASGAPVRTAGAASVIAETATSSDALSTTLFLLGAADGKRLVNSLPQTAAIWISPEGATDVASTGPQIVLEKSAVELDFGSTH
jgi:thiamine biosynthesis lipoprotein